MAAYVIVEVDVQNPEGYEEYKRLSTAAGAQYGAKFLARGGVVEVWEGEFSPKRVVILEFEDLEAAKRWYNSPEYTEAKAIRQKYAITNMFVVEGVSQT
jgi:uncharacterized protein (DUF1330 family)